MRFLVVDEHPLLRAALESLITRRFSVAEILAVESHEQAMEVLRRLPADLVVTDLLCCRAGDREGLRDLVGAAAPGRIVVFGRCSGGADARRAQTAGVHGYVPATSPSELIGAAIGLVLAGGLYFPQLSAVDRQTTAGHGRQPMERLSPRQREVLRGLQAGQGDKAIAQALGLSVATVKLHVQGILRHVGAHNRTEAVMRLADRDGERVAAVEGRSN
jgi:two-component system nitrate/nitrite response regulator NarL